MVFGKIKGALFRAFKRGHPDVYKVLKKYCDERGLNVSDVTASAVMTWVAADEEGKKDLEQAMAARRTGGGGGSVTSMKPMLGMFKDICESMGSMFKAMNEARAGMSMESMLSDFKAVSTALTEIKKTGSESGKGSMEDLLATALITKIFGGKKGEKAAKTKTGTGKIKKVKD